MSLAPNSEIRLSSRSQIMIGLKITALAGAIGFALWLLDRFVTAS